MRVLAPVLAVAGTLLAHPTAPAHADGESGAAPPYLGALAPPQSEAEFGAPALYLGVAGNYSVATQRSGANRWGLDARIGLRLLDRLSVEWEFDAFIGAGSGAVFASTLNGKGHILTGRLQPYALVGGGIYLADRQGESTKGRFAMRFGAGVDYYMTRNWVAAVGADYLLPVTGINDADLVQINFGFQYVLRPR